MARALSSLVPGVARRLGLEPRELTTLALMGALVGILFQGYTIAKVLRDALFLREFGALALPYAYVGVALASAGFVWLDAAIQRRFTRLDPMHFNQLLAIAIGAALAMVYPHARHWAAAALYLWTGSQILLVLSHFWVLALDVWDSRRARRAFPVLSGFGLIGGLLGGGTAAWFTGTIGREGLAWTMVTLLAAAHVLTRLIELRHPRKLRTMEARSNVSRWRIIRESGYIKVFVVGIALSVIVSTLVDFQFKFYIQRIYPGPHQLTEFLGLFYFGLNMLALVFQFGIAGWLLHRLGLGASTGLQPTAVLVFAVWMLLGTGGWVIVAMRWVQGVVFQTLGKSSGEIYYAAIRPSDRRRIKPAIDTLVERWSDAAVGVLLLTMLTAFRLSLTAIAIATAALAALWLVVLLVLDRRYARAFEEALSRRWVEPGEAAELMRVPAARRAVLDALRDPDERRAVLALQLAQQVRDRAIVAAVRDAVKRPSPALRAAAIRALEALGWRDPDGEIEPLLQDPSEGVRRAAVSFRLTRGKKPIEAARRLLESEDPVVRRHVLEVMHEHPQVGGALTREWIESRRAAESAEERQLAALAIGIAPGSPDALPELLGDPDLEVRRVALLSVARCPSRQLLEIVLPLLLDPQLGLEARQAITAIGDRAVPPLRLWLQGAHGAPGQAVAARTLGRIGGGRAVRALAPLMRSRDVWLRHLVFQSFIQMRVAGQAAIVSRRAVHHLFLRELKDYLRWLEPARALADRREPEVRLLAESCRESAEMALERGIQALAFWYEPRPLLGALERLRSGDDESVAMALEYLSHLLPRSVFGPLSEAFEQPAETAESAEGQAGAELPLSHWIRVAWDSEDAWLRACAVRASRYDSTLDPRTLSVEDDAPEIVRSELAARIAALLAAPPLVLRLEPRPC